MEPTSRGGGEDAAAAGIRYEGATTIGLYLLPDLTPLLQRRGVRLASVGGLGTNAGLEAVRAGRADVAGVMREISEAERAEPLRWEVVGYDALGVFVHGQNPVRALSRAQLRDVFLGRVRSWRELGGGDGPVRPVTERKAGGRGTVVEFRRIVLGGAEYGPTEEYEDAPDCVRRAAADPLAITVASMSMAEPGVRALALDGVEPGGDGIRSGAYLLGRPMYLVGRQPPPAGVAALLEIALSREGQAVIARRFTPAR
ncbi:MAG TPA: substrate-binding domain-containing protein [Anaeromyxobacteraceae bacterium]|nr:substrate-binding domain-containing protein [Anaeromyxobacteraceae bacterium]